MASFYAIEESAKGRAGEARPLRRSRVLLQHRDMTRETWTGRFGFVMATAGFAVGLGNIWRFPYLAGMNGGGAFLALYLAFALLIGIPLLTIEVGLGRKARRTPIAGMARLTGSLWKPWSGIGWLAVAAAVLIQSYYVMVIGWIVGSFVQGVTRGFGGDPPEVLAASFAQFVANPGPVLGYTALVMVVLAAVVARGLRQGLERLAKVAMPVLLVLLVGLAVRSLTFPGAAEGLRWYLTPDFSAIDGATALAALGQAFYSIGIGMAAAFAFGSYLDRESSDVPGDAAVVVLFDTAIAVLAGLVIFPALFAFGMAPDQGPGLIFVTLTGLFGAMPAGQLFGTVFFVLLLLAALTSAGALHEVLTSTLTDLVPMARRRASWWVAGSVFLLSIPIVLSQGPWAHLRIADMDLFTLADTVSGNVLLPVGGLLMVLYTIFVWRFERFRDELAQGATWLRVGGLWKPLILWLIPIAVTAVLLAGLGVLGRAGLG